MNGKDQEMKGEKKCFKLSWRAKKLGSFPLETRGSINRKRLIFSVGWWICSLEGHLAVHTKGGLVIYSPHTPYLFSGLINEGERKAHKRDGMNRFLPGYYCLSTYICRLYRSSGYTSKIIHPVHWSIVAFIRKPEIMHHVRYVLRCLSLPSPLFTWNGIW